MNLESEVYKSIETYSPPNLKRYISTEVEQLLSSKVTVFNRSECMPLINQSQFVQCIKGLTLPLYFYFYSLILRVWAIQYFALVTVLFLISSV